MKIIIAAIALTLFCSTFTACLGAEESPEMQKFYGDKEKCGLLSKLTYDAYYEVARKDSLLSECIKKERGLLLDVLYDMALQNLLKLPYVKANPDIFKEAIVEGFLREGIKTWEEVGIGLLVFKEDLGEATFRVCMEKGIQSNILQKTEMPK